MLKVPPLIIGLLLLIVGVRLAGVGETPPRAIAGAELVTTLPHGDVELSARLVGKTLAKDARPLLSFKAEDGTRFKVYVTDDALYTGAGLGRLYRVRGTVLGPRMLSAVKAGAIALEPESRVLGTVQAPIVNGQAYVMTTQGAAVIPAPGLADGDSRGQLAVTPEGVIFGE